MAIAICHLYLSTSVLGDALVTAVLLASGHYTWADMVCHLAYKEVLKEKITITVMLRNLFWLQCMCGTCIADDTHETSPSFFSPYFWKLLSTLLLEALQERYMNCVSYNNCHTWDFITSCLSSPTKQSEVFMLTTFTLRTVLFWTRKMGLIGCPETSVRNYCYSLHGNPEECNSYQLRVGSLKARNPYGV
jgi:hypothetical protein